MNQTDGESCPGAEECSTTAGKPLHKYPDEPEETVCGSCRFRGSKPENIDNSLIGYVVMATELEEIRTIGGTFQYPDALTAVEWEALTALQRGRDRAAKLKEDRDKKKPKPKN